MILFVTKPEEAVKLINGIMPKELFEMVQNADAGEIAAATEAKTNELAEENARLKAELEARDK